MLVTNVTAIQTIAAWAARCYADAHDIASVCVREAAGAALVLPDDEVRLSAGVLAAAASAAVEVCALHYGDGSAEGKRFNVLFRDLSLVLANHIAGIESSDRYDEILARYDLTVGAAYHQRT